MKLAITIVLSICLLTNCTRTLYVPNAVNTPLLEQKHDYTANLNMRLIAPFNIEFQGAFAPINHFAVMGNASAMGYASSKTETSFEHHLFEAGAGVFGAFWKNNCGTHLMRAEFFGGYGIGGADIVDDFDEIIFPDPTVRSYDGKYHRKFIQPAFDIKTKVVEFSLAARFSEVNFSKYNDYEDGVRTATGTYNFSTIEPVFRLAFGYQGWKIAGQFGYVESLGSSDTDFVEATGDAWGNIHFNGSFMISSWNEACPPAPEVTLGISPSSKDIAQSNKFPPPPTILHLKSSTATICFQDGGSPDGDVVERQLQRRFRAA